MATAPPLISVIVVAHDRRQYLRTAIQSVLAQDLDRSRFEIVTVKNFVDPELDGFLHEVGAHSILCTEVSIAKKFLAGFAASRGEIITFLEDDDAYETGRLRAVAGAFEAHPDLGFFRNDLSNVDEMGRPLAFTWGRLTAEGSLFIPGSRKAEHVRRLVHRYPDFNCSSMAIHRDVFEVARPYLAEAKGGAGAVDILLFFAALVFDRSLILDDRRLTLYRLHGGNASQLSARGGVSTEAQLRRLVATLRLIIDFNLLTRRLVARYDQPFALRLIDARILVSRLQLAYTDATVTRRDVVRIVPGLLRYFDTFPVQNSLLTVLVSPLYLFSPSIARRLWGRAAASVRPTAG